MISVTQKGDFSKFSSYMERLKEFAKLGILDKYGRLGVSALAAATPVETGETASSWDYKIERDGDTTSLSFFNTHINKGVNIAVILQYGHGTGTGGWVQGRDYINPAVDAIMQKILADITEEINNL